MHSHWMSKTLFKSIPCLSFSKINKELIVVVDVNDLLLTLIFFKNHITFQYNLLTAISGIDLLRSSYRFCLAYDLLSISYSSRIRLKIYVNEYDRHIPSSTSIFKNANWWEREAWDLFGIYFDKHPDLRRILTDYGFESYPLRKDFPLQGFIELLYDVEKGCIIPKPVELSQDFRNFNFESPW